MAIKHANEYLAKHQLYDSTVDADVSPELNLVIVIPCHDEPALIETLESLWRCDRPDVGVEILILINASDRDPAVVLEANTDTERAARKWALDHGDSAFRCHVLIFNRLPHKHAGVGLARKLGMDTGVTRLTRTVTGRGVLVSLDADCTVSSNYLTELVSFFQTRGDCNAAIVYYEHPLDSCPDTAIVDAISQYELHLRYYVHALRYSGFPYAQHTVGSTFAVRSECYAAQGGMNKRKAGEDFYFLHKLMPLGEIGVIGSTCVYPSPRISKRVPFGTGRVVERLLQKDSAELSTYSPEIFADLRVFFENLDAYGTASAQDILSVVELPAALSEYLAFQDFSKRVREIRANTATAENFRLRLLRWFNGFRVMKYVRYASKTDYPEVPVTAAARTLLEWFDEESPKERDLGSLLSAYRRRDREDIWPGIKNRQTASAR